MSFNTSFGIANPRASPPLTAPTSEQVDLSTQAIMDDINFMLACLEGSFLYDSGTLPQNSTGFQSAGGPVSTFPPRCEATDI
jgi:hypothetical protein